MTGNGLDATGAQDAFAPTFYTIPYGCLVPEKLNGLLLAGRNISGTHMAHANYRVMPICANMGQAAGIAAALCAKDGIEPRDLDVAELQKILQNGNRCGIYTVLCGAEIQESEKRDTTKVSMIESLKKSCTILEPVEDFFKLTPFNVMLQPRKQLRYFQTSDFVERYIQALEVVDERKKNKAPENDYRECCEGTRHD